MRSKPGAERAGGFTLVEVLVAFAIAAALLVPLLRLFSGGAGELARSGRATTAALWAQSLLAEPGDTASGDLPDGFHWRRTVAPYAEPDLTLSPTTPLVPYRVMLSVSWTEDRRQRAVTLETLTLAPPAQVAR